MKSKFVFLAAMTIAFFSIQPQAFSQKKEVTPKKEKDKVLANKVYTLELTEKDSKKNAKTEKDEISFKSEKLNSKFMTSEYKFPAAEYTVSVDSSSESKTITFQSDSKNQDGEELKWDGTITDETIEGTVVITSKKGKTKAEYSFSGEQKVKGKKK